VANELQLEKEVVRVWWVYLISHSK
jgi:hypothetical protein